MVISQPLLHDIYLRKFFKEGLKTKVKMAIISMLQKTLGKVTKSTILIEEEMLVRRKNITRYHQESYIEELEEFDEEEKWKPNKKEMKYHFETYRRCVYCQNYYVRDILQKNVKY
jgi:acetoin utilization deacetylase AcuC-like enzyme